MKLLTLLHRPSPLPDLSASLHKPATPDFPALLAPSLPAGPWFAVRTRRAPQRPSHSLATSRAHP